MRISLLIAAALLLALLSSCGGGGRAGSTSGNNPGGNNSGQNPTAPADAGRAVTLALSSAPASEGQLGVTLRASGAADLYQMSLRLAYDPRAVRPLDLQRGALIDERAVFFSGVDQPAARAAAYVPVAFTYHPGEAIPAASGELLRLRFEVLDSGRDPGLKLITASDYLIARDRGGADLQVLTGAGDE